MRCQNLSYFYFTTTPNGRDYGLQFHVQFSGYATSTGPGQSGKMSGHTVPGRCLRMPSRGTRVCLLSKRRQCTFPRWRVYARRIRGRVQSYMCRNSARHHTDQSRWSHLLGIIHVRFSLWMQRCTRTILWSRDTTQTGRPSLDSQDIRVSFILGIRVHPPGPDSTVQKKAIVDCNIPHPRLWHVSVWRFKLDRLDVFDRLGNAVRGTCTGQSEGALAYTSK